MYFSYRLSELGLELFRDHRGDSVDELSNQIHICQDRYFVVHPVVALILNHLLPLLLLNCFFQYFANNKNI